LEVTTELVENRDEDNGGEDTEPLFTDVDQHNSHFEGITSLTNAGIIHGYPLENGQKAYKPYQDVSRAHTAVLLTRALDLAEPDNLESILNQYEDVDTDHLYADEIAAVSQADIFKGNHGLFHGDSS